MRGMFTIGLSGAVAVAALSGFTILAANIATGAAAREPAHQDNIAVNRALKGDRLPRLAPTVQPVSPAGETATSPQRAPLGCDPAFSAISRPAPANVFRRCIA